jgi:hypothetical protein
MRWIVQQAACVELQEPSAAAYPPAPIWHTHLWTADPPNPNKPRWMSVVAIRHEEDAVAGVSFLDNNRLFTYHVVSTVSLADRHSLKASGSYRLDLLMFDVGSGHVSDQKSWPTRRNFSFARSTAAGLLVRRGDNLISYNQRFEQLGQITIQADPEAYSTIVVSPSGKTVMLNRLLNHASEIEILDPRTLHQQRFIRTLASNAYSLSDLALAVPDTSSQRILVHGFESHALTEVEARFKRGCVAEPIFATDVTIVNALCDVSVVTLSGQVLLQDSPKQETIGPEIAVSRSGDAIAVPLTRGKGGGFWDTDVRMTAISIAVYSIPHRKRVLTIQLSPLPTQNCDFALSPDGSRLAILNDGDLLVYSVPQD